MVAAGDAGKSEVDVAERLDIEPEMVVQEIGWDEDVDDAVRASIEQRCGSELLDEDADEVVDVVLLWWRDDDGDLTDTLLANSLMTGLNSSSVMGAPLMRIILITTTFHSSGVFLVSSITSTRPCLSSL